jgi:proteasome alpha subunit
LYRIAFDGSIGDEKGFAAIGGQAEELRLYLKDKYEDGLDQTGALRLAPRALEAATSAKVKPENLEVAILERGRTGRTFRRLSHGELQAILAGTE